MAIPTQQLSLLLTIALFVHFTDEYSFQNCIGDQILPRQKISCIRRKENDLSKIVGDLPPTVINISISINPIQHIPRESFSRLTNLQSLKMDHNHLKTIDRLAFKNLHQLRILNLSCNYISELNDAVFEELHNLTHLLLEDNRLKLLPKKIFSHVPNLNTLILRQNHLENFSALAQSVSSLMNLKLLDLCNNSLTSLSHFNISLPKSLNILYICRNHLSTLSCDPSFLRYVQLLDLSYNRNLSSIAFKDIDLKQIHYLRLRSTNVKVFDLFNVSNINPIYVDFSGVGLKNNTLINDLCKLLSKRVKSVQKMMLGSNQISQLNISILSNCPQIRGIVDLSRNNMKTVGCLEFLEGQKNIQVFNAEHNHLTNLKSCQGENKLSINVLSYRYNRIRSVNSFAFSHTPYITTLKLNINTIAFLDRKALKGLTHLQTLHLDNNLLTDLFDVTFQDLHSLQILNLRNNDIAVIFNGTFLSLSRLTTLDLGGNKITHFEASGLDGLKKLTNLYLDGNNLKQIDSSLYVTFQNTLEVLDLQRNQIRFLSEKSISPFVNLSKLSDLKLDGQRPFGISYLPHAFFRGLRSLRALYFANNRIVHLAADAFDDLTGLRFLTLDDSCVGVVQLQPGVFKSLRNLTRLIVENLGIQNFSKDVFANLTKLRTLQLNNNVMQSIDVDVLEGLPMLQYLDIRNNPLSCTCKNSILKNWTLNNDKVELVYLHSLPCQESDAFNFYNFDTNVCYIDLGLYLFFTTAAVLVVFTVVPLMYVKLYWKMKYGYYVFRAWFSEQWRKLREEEESLEYDAFISYNSCDEHWILDQLLPNLEGNGSSFKLCLHHRDFEPGRNIVDNIVSAVYGSRKTICIVSQNFLQSEWCSLEIQLASYRLFDEHRDVLLLVFLEDIPERQLSSYHRMRKVMLKKTYLQWPGSECTDPTQAQDLFWKQLRKALRSCSRMEDEEETVANNRFGSESDESHYLSP